MRALGNIISLDNSEEWVQTICSMISNRITETLKTKATFNIAISGGNTPKLVFEELIQNNYVENEVWKKVNFFWVDERIVPVEHPESNFGNAMKFLSKIPATFYPLYDSKIGVETSIVNYNKYLEIMPKKNHFPHLDLILLGMGEDGHTASLFPQTEGLLETKQFVIHNEVPQLNTSRITFTFPLIKNSSEIFILINKEKINLLKEMLDQKTNYPIEKLFEKEINKTWIYYN